MDVRPEAVHVRGGDATGQPAAENVLTGLFGRDALFMVAWAVQLVVAALATPFITRVMPRAEFGLVASGTAVMQVLFVLAGAGLATAIQRQHGHGRHVDARKLLSVAVVVSAAVGRSCDWPSSGRRRGL
jgi:hypothetical protein